jgi:hypothetical protein
MEGILKQWDCKTIKPQRLLEFTKMLSDNAFCKQKSTEQATEKMKADVKNAWRMLTQTK